MSPATIIPLCALLVRLTLGLQMLKDSSVFDANQSKTPPFVFLKLHKVGSGTMGSILASTADKQKLSCMLPPHSIYLGWPGPFPGDNARYHYGAAEHQYDCLFNHAVYNSDQMRKYLKQNPFVFTIVREPLSRMESAWDFYKNYYPNSGNDSWAARIKILQSRRVDPDKFREPFVHGDPTRFWNSMAYDLGWYEHKLYKQAMTKPGVADDAAVRQWLDELEEGLDFVMITEAFDEGAVLLRRRLGLSLTDMRYLRQHSQSHGKRVPPTSAELASLDPFLHVDKLLYNRLNQSFWRKWEKAGGYKALGGEVEQLRSMNQALEQACSHKKNSDACPEHFTLSVAAYNEKLRKNR